MNKQLMKHNDVWYKVIKYLPEHSVRNKDGSINLDVVREWMLHVGGDHVLRDNNGYMLCETIQDAQLIDQ